MTRLTVALESGVLISVVDSGVSCSVEGLTFSRNVVLDSASLSISNAIVSAKLPFYFSSSCCIKAVGIAHQPLRCL